MKKIKLLFRIVLLALIVSACQKSDELNPLVDDDLVVQEIEIEDIMADIDAVIEEIIDFHLGVLKSATFSHDDEETCPVVTYYRNSEPRRMVIDFGAGCEGKDGKIRSGKVIVTSSNFENRMVTRVKSFEDFFVDGTGIDGTISKTVTLIRELKMRISTVIEEVTISSGEKVFTRTANLTRVHELGEKDNRRDDVVTSWGVVVTVRPDGLIVTKLIEESNPLQFLNVCRQIVSGVVYVTAGENSWSIDYGSGDCDNKATVTRNGVEKEIKIRRK